MLAAVASFVLIHGSPLVPARVSRAAFCTALDRVQLGWTKDQVKKVLGPPDDIWPKNDSPRYVPWYGRDRWGYGTNGHHTMATLGSVDFEKDRVCYVVGQDRRPPSPKVISEKELSEALRAMHIPPGDPHFSSDLESEGPAYLIRVTNLLIPKGDAKAKAIISEFDRVEWGPMFWLVRVLFKSNRPGGVFPVPKIGAITPSPPGDLKKWPTYPIAIVDDIPMCMVQGVGLYGAAELFSTYFDRHKSEWSIRKSLLVPPNDPFLTYKRLISSRQWLIPSGKSGEGWTGFVSSKTTIFSEVLAMVRTAYRPNRNTEWRPVDLFFDEYYRQFLKLKCRWDIDKQMYVRGDGTTIVDPEDNYLQHQHRFIAIPQLGVEVTFHRRNPTTVSFTYESTEKGTRPVPPAILVAEDAKSGVELGWRAINGNESSDRKTVLKQKAHANSKGSQSGAGEYELPKGGRVRFVILSNGKRYVSPMFRP